VNKRDAATIRRYHSRLKLDPFYFLHGPELPRDEDYDASTRNANARR
jgi:hypothetical protein